MSTQESPLTLEQTKEADRRFEATLKAIDIFIGRFDEMIEKLLDGGNLVNQFRELGYRIKVHCRNKKFGKKGTAHPEESPPLFSEEGGFICSAYA